MTDTRHYMTKSIEQRTLETLERIETALLNIMDLLEHPPAVSEEALQGSDTPRAPKRTPESPDANKAKKRSK